MKINELDNIDELLRGLSPDQTTDFRLALIDRLEDRDWCEIYGIPYVNPEPEMRKVEFIVLQELYPDVIN